MASTKLAQRLDEERCPGAGEGARAERARVELCDCLHLRLGREQALEDLIGVTRQRLARVGEPNRSGLSIDQHGTDLPLERGDDLRYRRLRVVQLVGGAREGAGRPDRTKDTQLLQLRHNALASRL